MSNILKVTVFSAAVFAASVAGAQTSSGSDSGMTGSDLASAATSAAKTLSSAAKDKLLVKDLLGATVKSPDGKTVGTVDDLVVVPGGRVVAAIIKTDSSDHGPLPVPFPAVKLAQAQKKLEMTLPATVSELAEMKEVQDLKELLPGL